MSRLKKLIGELKACHGAFPYRDMTALLGQLGFEEKATGGGARRRFVHAEKKLLIKLHEPHPGNEIKAYMVREVREYLIEEGLI